MRVIKVQGLRPNDPAVHYCGRACAGWRPSPVGNPYVIGRDGTRAEVIARFRAWLFGRVRAGDPGVCGFLRALPADAALGCWCADLPDPLAGPEVCHAQVVAKAARWVRGLK